METGKHWRIALIGTPNSGKTSLFNTLTNSWEHVGNYPGVTVDVASGLFVHRGHNFAIEDLPGLYSIHSATAEERVSADALVRRTADLTLVACDVTNLERGLHLVLQIIETGIPLCIVLTKTDLLSDLGMRLDSQLLARLLKCPVLTLRDETESESFFDALLAAVLEQTSPPPFRYPVEIENEVERIEKALKALRPNEPAARAMATALLSSLDSPVLSRLNNALTAEVSQLVEQSRQHLETVHDETPAMTITHARYGTVRGILRECQTLVRPAETGLHDFLDHLFLWRLTGIPLLLVTLFFIFFIPFVAGAPLSEFVDGLFSDLATLTRDHIAPGTIRDLVSDGIIGGVGGVLVFLPQLFLLYSVIAFIESSGYMARAAFVLDSFMHKIGLHGKSFLPFILGFGCSVPAILATRTLENRNDRLATMMALPFISCSARLPVFTLLIAALFPSHLGGLVLLGLYACGILLALVSARIFRRWFFRARHEPVFLMDLPPWRMPTLFGIMHQAGEQTLHFFKKAGTILLAAAIIFWFLSNYPKPSSGELESHGAAIRDLSRQAALFRPDPANTDPAVIRAHGSIQQIWCNFSNAVSNASPLSQQYRIAESRRTHALASVSNADSAAFITGQGLVRSEQGLQREIRRQEQVWKDSVRQQSYAGRIGSMLAPLLAPLGLDDWKIAVALLSGFAAKEMVVTTLGSIYGTQAEDSEGLASRLRRDPVFLAEKPVPPSAVLISENGDLRHARSGFAVSRIRDQYYPVNPWTAVSLLVFILLYVPCQAATIVFAKEAGIRLALIMIVWTTLVAWSMGTLVSQLGRLLG